MADSLLPDPPDGIGAASFSMTEPTRALSLWPIGVVHSPHGERVEAPRQPAAASEVEGTVELFAGHGYEDALCDLATWDHLWLVVWFDRNRGFRPKVSPPRSDKKRGVFATRSPYRPNPIGLSAVRLLGVSGLVLHVRGLDLLDQTPVLDLKPYVPYTDAIPEANHGWLDAAALAGLTVRRGPTAPGARPLDPVAPMLVTFTPHVVDQRERIEAQLALGVAPHAYRRIKRDGDQLRLAIKDWRVWFRVEGAEVTVERIGSGYRPRELFGPEGHAPQVHRAFVARWP
jgi:tRNA-Thr(GGU) m(6)t(6)A37 methyltransferase TsaA